MTLKQIRSSEILASTSVSEALVDGNGIGRQGQRGVKKTKEQIRSAEGRRRCRVEGTIAGEPTWG